jgi:RNA polymerase sigma factor (sigma-70 family)
MTSQTPTFDQWEGLTHHVVQKKFEYAYSLDPKIRKIKVPIEYDDLIQVASLALLDAIEGWDPERETKFKTYAYQAIKNKVKMHVDSTIRSLDWQAQKFSEIELRHRKNRDAVQILDPSQDQDLYNVLHTDWVDSCMDRIRERVGEEDLRMLVEHAGGKQLKDIARERGVSYSLMKRLHSKARKAAFFAVKDQEELLE